MVIFFQTASSTVGRKENTRYRLDVSWAIGRDEGEKDFGIGAKIIEYVATAAKSYAYVVRKSNGDIAMVVKCKGFFLDCFTSRIITFDTMKRLVEKFVEDKVTEKLTVNCKRIRRDKDHTIVTVTVPKIYQTVFTKRNISCE